MIARIFIFIILAIVLPDVYVYARYLRRRTDITLWQHFLWWFPGIVMIAYTTVLSLIRDFAPTNAIWLNAYLFLLGLVVVPKLLFVTCSATGLFLRCKLHLRRNWGNYVGVVMVLASLYMLIYGSTVSISKVRVRHVEMPFADLPPAFDGYRIVQFTDAHVGSINPDLLLQAVLKMNQLNPDAIVFTGDLQNMQPRELRRFASLLKTLKAKDGVFSVLGNHDYAMYLNLPEAEKRASEDLLCRDERALGWRLLLNGHAVVRRGADSLVVAGTENDGRPPFPSRADYAKALNGVGNGAFVVMLQHDPSAWRRNILPSTRAQLTLSGHTHGGQISLFGFRPTELSGTEDSGLYREGKRVLYVSTGLGGFIPFRFGIPPEVVEITLKAEKH